MKDTIKSMKAKDIMTKELLSVEKSITVEEATQLMDKHNIGALVVLSPIKDILGIFTERDLVRRVVAKKLDPAKIKIEKVMTPSVMVAQANDSAMDLLEVMFCEKFRHLPVVDGRTVVGIISLKDFYKCLLENTK